MAARRRIGLTVLIWVLRLAALGTLALWFIPTREYEATALSERTYFGLGWPDHWLASEVRLTARPTMGFDGKVTHELRHRGPLTAWDPPLRSKGLGDAFGESRWKRVSPLHGPVLLTACGLACCLVAGYLNKFRRSRSAVEAETQRQDLSS